MAANLTEFKCSNSECRVSETGKCVEGLEPSVCPHLIQEGTPAKTVDDAINEDIQRIEEATGSLTMPSGTHLRINEASALLRGLESRLIAIIGPPGSGKTTLVSSMYDLFQDGPVEGMYFSRSRTLYAFESTCHDARTSSQRTTPDTKHTPRGEVSFFHLCLTLADSGIELDLILGDRSGEDYRSIMDDCSIAAGFIELRRADTIAILVDGTKLIDLGDRHNVRSEIELIVQGLEETNTINRKPRLAVVLTKMDEVEQSIQQERVYGDFDKLIQRVQELSKGIFSEIKPFQVAASPKSGSFPKGYGLSSLLQHFTIPLDICEKPVLAPPNLSRAIDRITVPKE